MHDDDVATLTFLGIIVGLVAVSAWLIYLGAR